MKDQRVYLLEIQERISRILEFTGVTPDYQRAAPQLERR